MNIPDEVIEEAREAYFRTEWGTPGIVAAAPVIAEWARLATLAGRGIE